LAAARLGRRHGVLGADGEDELTATVASLGLLPSICNIDPKSLRIHIGRDKKRGAEGIGWVLPTDDGVVLNRRVETDEAVEVFRELQQLSNSQFGARNSE
jgi:3-dehydroquinate synthetase